jgi:hypothetical protein
MYLIARISTILTLLILINTVCHAHDFVLQEKLGRSWTNEFVSFPLDKAQLDKANRQALLINQAGQPVSWQLLTGANGEPRIGFQTDLKKYSTNNWNFSSETIGNKAASDLKIEDTDDILRISNTHTGIAIAKHPKEGAGPISEVMLNSGKWVGSSQLTTETQIKSWKVEITESGPVMAEIKCAISFGGKGAWETRYRLYANEPVILVDEKFSVDTEATFTLTLGEKFKPSELFYRRGKGKIGKNSTWTLQSGNIFTMEPWLKWWLEERRGSTFSLYNSDTNDLFTMAAREAGAWVNPEIPPEKRTPPQIQVTRNTSGVHASFPLAQGERKWFMGAFDKDASLAVLKDPKQIHQSPLPYRYLIKHGHFPLDEIKDYVLSWPSTLEYPRLLITKNDIDRFKARPVDHRFKIKTKEKKRKRKKIPPK